MRDPEAQRLEECRAGAPWKKWGPYLSERQWGTVREDYSADGNAWDYFTHDQARSRAYRWGEDGIAGISDDRQLLCFALALWNGQDPILKERLFGLTNSEGNHGEDVKEYYFYLDSTPTHSYMRHLYKYPHAAYPYENLLQTTRQRSRQEPEYELIDTGVFAANRYCDVFTEYAKHSPEEIFIVVTLINRGPEPVTLHVLPTLWFRNTWSGHDAAASRPQLSLLRSSAQDVLIEARHPVLGTRYLHCEGNPIPLFTENETNARRLFGHENATRFTKDGIHEYVVMGRPETVNSAGTGTKVAGYYRLTLQSQQPYRIRLRLSDHDAEESCEQWTQRLEMTLRQRRRESDEFYSAVVPGCDAEAAPVLRQALAGMLWSKQFYYYDVQRWLQEHGSDTAQSHHSHVRNHHWLHMCNEQVISMPDKWEYPWYAAWDLVFHTVALSMVDMDFAAEQLQLMLRSFYLHPNGQIPAYEWNFSDVNPPVHAWGVLFLHTLGKRRGTPLSHDYLRTAFQHLTANFTWWVNRKDRAGRNVFEGGFLGLDNIGAFDRNMKLPEGGSLTQADGTAWMAFYSQTMLALALELALADPWYEEAAAKFLEHFLWIGGAMDQRGDVNDELWDQADGFFYDVLCLPNGSAQRLRIRSMVGLLPLCATLVLEPDLQQRFPAFVAKAREFIARHPELTANLASIERTGVHGRRLLAVVDETKLRRLLTRMLDETQFLSPFGVRSLSKEHLNPYVLQLGEQRHELRYLPGESDSGMFGGNSNWRGPVWLPVNVLIIRALLELYRYYGDDFQIECPTGSGQLMSLFDVAMELCRRLEAIFTRDASGRRPMHGDVETFQVDPHWCDYLLFYEYFHGDHGAGLGASHQTGWTGVIARTIQLRRTLTANGVLNSTRL